MTMYFPPADNIFEYLWDQCDSIDLLQLHIEGTLSLELHLNITRLREMIRVATRDTTDPYMAGVRTGFRLRFYHRGHQAG